MEPHGQALRIPHKIPGFAFRIRPPSADYAGQVGYAGLSSIARGVHPAKHTLGIHPWASSGSSAKSDKNANVVCLTGVFELGFFAFLLIVTTYVVFPAFAGISMKKTHEAICQSALR